MVSDPTTQDIVCWNDRGDGFMVKNEFVFASQIMRSYFRHQNFSSFVRQVRTHTRRDGREEKEEGGGGRKGCVPMLTFSLLPALPSPLCDVCFLCPPSAVEFLRLPQAFFSFVAHLFLPPFFPERASGTIEPDPKKID
jgi:hypothetical protein